MITRIFGLSGAGIVGALGLVISLAAIPSATLIAGCGPGDPQRRCKVDDSPRVAENRVVTLVAENYIYAFAVQGPAYPDLAREAIAAAYATANEIFRDNDINLQIVGLNPWVKTDVAGMTVSIGPDELKMMEIHEGHSRYIGVHWSEWYKFKDNFERPVWFTGTLCPSERCNYINLVGAIRNPPSEGLGKYLARAIAAYLNAEDNLSTTNLMGPASGTELTTVQRNQIWEAVNTGRVSLYSLTCDPPVIAPILPDNGFSPAPTGTSWGTLRSSKVDVRPIDSCASDEGQLCERWNRLSLPTMDLRAWNVEETGLPSTPAVVRDHASEAAWRR